MIALDTNIILRLIVRDDETQTEDVRAFLHRNDNQQNPPFVSDLVLVETVWVLRSRYRFSREAVGESLRDLFLNTLLEFEGDEYILEVLQIYLDTQADFADIMIAKGAQRAGCRNTVTFDRTAIKLGLMQPLEHLP
jgi:predicted nucleic-acid-binding protein